MQSEKRLPILATFAVALCMLAGLASCELPAGPVTTQRTLSFDVSAALFASPTETIPGNRGPGIDSIAVTITVNSDGKDASLPVQTFAASSLTAGAAYGNFSLSVTGQLKDIAVSGTSGGTTVVSADVSDVAPAEVGRYGGWTRFGDVTFFKIDWSGGDSTEGTIRVLPCPRSAATVLADSGPQSGIGNTDLAASVKTRQVALQVVPAEYTGAENLTYQIYYAVAAKDPSVLYNDALFPNTYLSNPWTALWTYDEVTGASGKKIGPDTYVMTKLAGGPFTAAKPDADGKYAVLVDLSANESATVGKYLLCCALLTRGGLSVPSDVKALEIQ